MSKIFISHSSKDKELVDQFVDLLKSGIGVLNNQIVCTSIDGQIPLGENFHRTIKNHLNESSLFIPILSESFNLSSYCLFEIGGAWALDKSIVPVLVPPISYDDMLPIVHENQAMTIDDKNKLSLMRDTISKKFNIQDQPSSIWEKKRDDFLTQISILLKRKKTWIYAISGNRIQTQEPYGIIGCFIERPVARIPNVITVHGYSYWVDPEPLCFRGEWISDKSSPLDTHPCLRYEMSTEPDGDARSMGEKHSGIIKIMKVDNLEPLIGSVCFRGYTHDLFEFRYNNPRMYTEMVNLPLDEVVNKVKSEGLQIYSRFSERIRRL